MAAARQCRWAVLGSRVSPYTTELWDRVASHDDHAVLLVHRARGRAIDYAHEAGGCSFHSLRSAELPFRGGNLRGFVNVLRWRPDVIVCLGNTEAYALAAVGASRVLARRAAPVYMADTNVLQVLNGLGHSPTRVVLHGIKRVFLPLLFDEAFALGVTNEAANSTFGLRSTTLPLYAVDFAALAGKPSGPRVLAETSPGPRLVCVARLVKAKNLVALVQAWKIHLRRGGPGSLTLIGEGPERALIEREVIGIPSDRLTLAGSVPRRRMGGVFAACDGLVLPSIREPWGIAVVEALGLGVPVLASSRVGSAVSLAPTCSGAVSLSAPDVPSLAENVSAFVSDLEWRTEAAMRISAHIRAQFDTNAVAQRLIRWSARQVPTGDGPAA